MLQAIVFADKGFGKTSDVSNLFVSNAGLLGYRNVVLQSLRSPEVLIFPLVLLLFVCMVLADLMENNRVKHMQQF